MYKYNKPITEPIIKQLLWVKKNKKQKSFLRVIERHWMMAQDEVLLNLLLGYRS